VQTVPGIHGVIGLRVPGAIGYRHIAIRLVSTACKMALETEPTEADDDFEAEVVSAFGEAFNNIAVHGFQGIAPQPVQIEVDWDDEKLVITFVDNGHVFDPGMVAPPDLDSLPEHGMGLFIMRSCMDQVDYRPGPPNVLRLIKLRGHREARLPPPPSSGSASTMAVPSPRIDALRLEPEEHPQDRGSGVDLIAPSNQGRTSRGNMRPQTPGADDRTVEGSRRR
jgi:serine/threonine-protein kinase RsbW